MSGTCYSIKEKSNCMYCGCSGSLFPFKIGKIYMNEEHFYSNLEGFELFASTLFVFNAENVESDSLGERSKINPS